MVHVSPSGGSVTAGEGAVPVSQADGVGDGVRPPAGGPSDVKDFPVGAEHEPGERTVAQRFDRERCFGVPGAVFGQADDEVDPIAVGSGDGPALVAQ